MEVPTSVEIQDRSQATWRKVKADESADETLAGAQCRHLHVMAKYGDNVTHAAGALGVSRSTLYRLLRKHGIA